MGGEIVRLPKVVSDNSIGARSLLLGGTHVLVALEGRLFRMRSATHDEDTGLMAPERLISATRGDFRTAALAHLDQLGADATAMVIDLRHTVELDASGLGMLVLIQKRAKDRGLSTRLRQTPERVRNLLKLTMLDFLFELTD